LAGAPRAGGSNGIRGTARSRLDQRTERDGVEQRAHAAEELLEVIFTRVRRVPG